MTPTTLTNRKEPHMEFDTATVASALAEAEWPLPERAHAPLAARLNAWQDEHDDQDDEDDGEAFEELSAEIAAAVYGLDAAAADAEAADRFARLVWSTL